MSVFNQKRILVPFDFSEESLDAMRMALLMSDQRENIHVVHVLAPLPVMDPEYVWIEDADERRMVHIEESIAKSLKDLGVQDIKTHVTVGDAGTEVARIADEIDADLIVIPSHGRTGVKRFLLGSVAERVVRLAHCPVFVLKKPASTPEE